MSQIRKYETGGTSPESAKKKDSTATNPTGKFRKDGRIIEGQLAADRISSAMMKETDPRRREMYQNALHAIRDGQLADYDSGRNALTVWNENGDDITAAYTTTNASPKDSWFKREVDAFFGTDRDAYKRGGIGLASVNMGPDIKVEDQGTTTQISKTPLARGTSYWEYDDEGNYLENSLANNERMNILNAIAEYGFAEDKSKWDTSGWGAYSYAINGLGTLLKNDPEYIAKLMDKIKKNENLTASELSNLKAWGFERGEGPKPTGLEIDPRITDEGFISWAKKNGIGAKLDKDGNIILTGNAAWAGEGTVQDLMGYDWADTLMEGRYKGGFSNSGMLYAADNILNNEKFINNESFGKYMKARSIQDFRARYNAQNASGVGFLWSRAANNQGDDWYGPYGTRYAKGEVYNPQIADFMNGVDGIAYMGDVSGAYNLDPTDPRKIYGFSIDRPGRDNLDQFGREQIKYLVFDPRNSENPYQTFDSESAMRTNLGLTPNTWGGISDFILGTYNDIGGTSVARVHDFKIAGGKQTLYIDRDGNYYWYKGNNQLQKINTPSDIVQIWKYIKYDWAHPGERTYRNDELMNIKKYQDLNEINALPTSNAQAAAQTLRDNAGQGIEQIYNVGVGNIAQNKMKQGGTITRHQYGGNILKTDQNIDTIGREGEDTNIYKDHYLDGSDGGLTNAERWQIAGASLDLAGVLGSFVPAYGNVVGAVTGGLGTTARLIGDIKQDGLDWGDAGRALVGYGMDALSVIPGLGTAAKTGKAIKRLKAIAPVLSKAAVATGLAATMPGFVTAIGKLTSKDEKMTSEDLQAILHGLSALTVGGSAGVKRMGRARLAAEQSAKQAKSAAKELEQIIQGESAITKKLGLNSTELEKIVKQQKGDTKKIAEVLRKRAAKKGVSAISNEEMSQIFDDLSLTPDGMKKRWLWGPKGVDKVAYEAPNVEGATSAWGYFFKPGKMTKDFNNGLLKGIDTNEINAAAKRVAKNTRGTGTRLRDQALMDQAVWNPDYFNEEILFKAPKGVSGWAMGGQRNIRNAAYQAEPAEAPLLLPKHYADIPGTPARPNLPDAPLILGAYSGQPAVTASTAGVMARPTYTSGTAPGYVQSTVTRTPKRTIQEVWATLSGEQRKQVKHMYDIMKNSGKLNKLGWDMTNVINHVVGTNVLKRGGVLPKYTSGGWFNKAVGWNPANIADASRVITQLRASDKVSDKLIEGARKGYDIGYSSPQYQMAPFSSSDIARSTQEQLKPIDDIKLSTSDASQALAGELSKGQMRQSIIANGNAQLSNKIDKYKEARATLGNQQAEQNAKVADSNRNQRAQTAANVEQAEANKITSHNGILSQYQLQNAQNERDRISKLAELDYQQSAKEASNRRTYDIQHSDAYIKLQDIFNREKAAGNVQSWEDMETWASRTPAYKQALTELYNYYTDNYASTMNNLAKKKVDSVLSSGFYYRYKSGGKTTQARPVLEQIQIDGNKLSKQQAAKLTESLLKMLNHLKA